MAVKDLSKLGYGFKEMQLFVPEPLEMIGRSIHLTTFRIGKGSIFHATNKLSER